MDDYNRLINSDNGTHCLIFLNQHALEEEEIKEIFSEFGYIHNLRYHKNKTGHWFVRYRSIDEAKYAVDSLKNHPKIKLSEHYNKKRADCQVSDRSQNNGHGQQACNGNKFNQQFGRQTNKKTVKSGYNKNGNNKENESIGNFDNDQWGPKSPNGNQKQNNPLRGSNSCGGNSDELPDLIDHNRKIMMERENQEDEIPELVTSNGKTYRTSIPMKKVLRAQEVIVANIHPQFGAPYILHLFDRFAPLAITNIMVEPKTAKRYCHVYFKSAEDSEQVESLFDKTSLLDQKLVVIRSSQLV